MLGFFPVGGRPVAGPSFGALVMEVVASVTTAVAQTRLATFFRSHAATIAAAPVRVVQRIISVTKTLAHNLVRQILKPIPVTVTVTFVNKRLVYLIRSITQGFYAVNEYGVGFSKVISAFQASYAFVYVLRDKTLSAATLSTAVFITRVWQIPKSATLALSANYSQWKPRVISATLSIAASVLRFNIFVKVVQTALTVANTFVYATNTLRIRVVAGLNPHTANVITSAQMAKVRNLLSQFLAGSTMTATVTTSAARLRQYMRSISAASIATTVTFKRVATKFFSYSKSVSATFLRTYVMVRSATHSKSATVARAWTRVFSGNVGVSVVRYRQYALIKSASKTLSASRTWFQNRVVSVTKNTSVLVVRRFAWSMSAAVSAAAVVVRLIPVTVSAFLSTSAVYSFFRERLFIPDIADSARRAYVPSEDRTMILPAENRTAALPAEDRVMTL